MIYENNNVVDNVSLLMNCFMLMRDDNVVDGDHDDIVHGIYT